MLLLVDVLNATSHFFRTTNMKLINKNEKKNFVVEFSDLMLEKDGEDQLDRSCEK